MFAIIKTGGKQFRVSKDALIVVEKLAGAEGDKVVFGEVLMIGSKVGAPLVAGASVSGEIVKQGRGEKVIVFKKHRRHGYKRKNGHKQHLTAVRITEIKG
ncbi:MAG: 50S ribosomal protein L21 [Alphaproteobacteria bacterium]|nr:50S ribosomal protein L21 [Alphaproteobacteria bacterium]